MNFLNKHIRPIIYVLSVVIAAYIYLSIKSQYATFDLQVIRLVQLFAFTTVIYLYITLIGSPLYSLFPDFAFRDLYFKARKALVISTFFFGLAHFLLAFFYSLGGFEGLGFLASKFLLAIIFSFTALLIIGFIALTSLDFFVNRFGRWWIYVQRLIYIAGLLIMIHAVLIGTHFIDLSQNIPQIFFFAVLILLVLEVVRADRYITTKFPNTPKFGLTFFTAAIVLTILSQKIFFPSSGGGVLSLGLHAKHLQQAQQQVQNAQATNAKRFSVSFNHSNNLKPNQDVELRFKVSDARSGEDINKFDRIYTKLLHLVVVDNQLQFFNHIHPEFKDGQFVITTKLPKDGLYRLYLDFQPTGAEEQQFAFALPIGTGVAALPDPAADKNFSKVFGDYKVSLKEDTFLASQMALGKQEFVFTINDAKTGDSFTNLKPYLGAFGHLVMINTETYEFIHVHPVKPLPFFEDDNAGPEVTFVPLTLSGNIVKPGTYRIFAQFNPNNNLMVNDFTINVQ